MNTPYGERAYASDAENNGSLDLLARSLRITHEDLEWWLEASKGLAWRFARTMKSTPHSYVVRGKMLNDADYLRAYGVILTFGVPGKFHSRTMVYLTDPETGRRWWAMSTHFWQSKIINMSTDGRDYGRQDAPNTAGPHALTGEQWAMEPYDEVGAFWEDLHAERSEEHQTWYWRFITDDGERVHPRVLDVGAGTGGTLLSKSTLPSLVTAIDPSQAMLNQLVVYHPLVKQVHNRTAQEHLEETREVYDVVIASYGSASYLTRSEIEGLGHLVAPGGSLVLSFYKDGNSPVLGPLDHSEPSGDAFEHGGFKTFVYKKEEEED